MKAIYLNKTYGLTEGQLLGWKTFGASLITSSIGATATLVVSRLALELRLRVNGGNPSIYFDMLNYYHGGLVWLGLTVKLAPMAYIELGIPVWYTRRTPRYQKRSYDPSTRTAHIAPRENMAEEALRKSRQADMLYNKDMTTSTADGAKAEGTVRAEDLIEFQSYLPPEKPAPKAVLSHGGKLNWCSKCSSVLHAVYIKSYNTTIRWCDTCDPKAEEDIAEMTRKVMASGEVFDTVFHDERPAPQEYREDAITEALKAQHELGEHAGPAVMGCPGCADARTRTVQ